MGNLNGTWYNELGSEMTITVSGNTISGTYETSVGSASGPYQLIGQTDTDNDQSQAVGWVVVWQNASGSSDSVTTWSGQLQIVGSIATIVTTWLLTTETSLGDDWRSTLIGKDVFTQLQPTHQEIAKSVNKGVKQSNPLKEI